LPANQCLHGIPNTGMGQCQPAKIFWHSEDIDMIQKGVKLILYG
jgi:hypothetical protein